MAKARVCEAQVSLISKEMVVPAKPTQRHTYFLSCFDIFWRSNHYNQRVLFYDNTQGQAQQAVMEKLKSSLAQCLVHYYPWCGRLSQQGVDRRLFIDCNDAGVEFVEASLDLPISLLSHRAFQAKPFFEHLCQKVDHSGDCLYSSPLLSIQATLFSDGGLALGISHSHVVADGQALWNFMVSWGECARGLPFSLPPVLDRKMLAVPNPSLEKATWDLNTKIKKEDIIEEEKEDEHNEDALKQTNVESVETASSSQDNKVADPSATVGTGPSVSCLGQRTPCVFNLSSSAVKKLKSEDGGVHTSYEVTCAHFWKHLTVARQRPSCEPTFFGVLVDFRSHMNPPLSLAYFGNAIGFGINVSTTGKIRSESLYATASRIHDTIVETIQGSIVVSFMHWLEIPDHDLMSTIYTKVPKGKGANVASSARFPVYEVDFGWGKPVAVRSPKVPGDGEMVFFGGHPKSTPGDVEICTCLPRDVLRSLIEDLSFLGESPHNPFDDE